MCGAMADFLFLLGGFDGGLALSVAPEMRRQQLCPSSPSGRASAIHFVTGYPCP